MEYTEKMMIEIDEALKDEEFVGKLAEAGDIAEFKAIFLTKGIEIDDEIAQAAMAKMEAIRNGAELTAEDLEMVAGGCKKCYLIYTVGGAVVGGFIGGAYGAVVGGCIGSYIGVVKGVKHDLKGMGR